MSLAHDGRHGVETFRRIVAETETAFAVLRQARPGADERVNEIVESVIRELKSSDALLVPVLGARPGAWSAGHTAVIVAIVALRIGMDLDYTHPQLTRLGLAALLHEIGASDGLRIFRALGPAYLPVAEVVRRAHEEASASGGDGGDAGRASHDAQVVAVAATYAHLSRQQPGGQRAWPPFAVKEILRRGRARFPDAILKSLIHLSVQFPVGGLVRLNSDEIARVVEKNDGLPLRPVVVVVPRRARPPAEPKRVDLKEHPFLFIVEFLGHEAPEPETEN